MSEEQVQDSSAPQTDAPEIDPVLMNDQSETKPGIPLLVPGNIRARVSSIEQVRNSKNTGNLIKILLNTLDETTSVSGEVIKPGFPLFTQIPITPTPNYEKAAIDRALKTFMVAAGIPEGKPGTGPFFPLDRYLGQVVVAKVKVTKETDDWPEKNEVKGYVLPK
jgi:hypothetical protein